MVLILEWDTKPFNDRPAITTHAKYIIYFFFTRRPLNVMNLVGYWSGFFALDVPGKFWQTPGQHTHPSWRMRERKNEKGRFYFNFFVVLCKLSWEQPQKPKIHDDKNNETCNLLALSFFVFFLSTKSTKNDRKCVRKLLPKAERLSLIFPRQVWVLQRVDWKLFEFKKYV